MFESRPLVGKAGADPATPKERIYSPSQLPICYLPIYIEIV